MGKLTPYRDEIARRYEAGEAMDRIAQDYDTSGSAVHYVLKRAGAKIRSPQEAKLLQASRNPVKDDTRRIAIEMPPTIWKRLYRAAQKHGGTLSSEALYFIETGMKRENKQ